MLHLIPTKNHKNNRKSGHYPTQPCWTTQKHNQNL